MGKTRNINIFMEIFGLNSNSNSFADRFVPLFENDCMVGSIRNENGKTKIILSSEQMHFLSNVENKRISGAVFFEESGIRANYIYEGKSNTHNFYSENMDQPIIILNDEYLAFLIETGEIKYRIDEENRFYDIFLRLENFINEFSVKEEDKKIKLKER